MKISLLPVYINKQSTPEILQPEDARFKEVADYIQEITERQGLNGSFSQEKGELIILPGE